jgi:hypothetical protein
MGQFEVYAKPEKNRLYIRFIGATNEQEMADAIPKLNSVVKDLKPGFTVVSDISEYKPSSQETAKQISRGSDNLIKKGMGRLVRVVGESAVAQMQIERTAQAGGIRADKVTSVEEAERLLYAEK